MSPNCLKKTRARKTCGSPSELAPDLPRYVTGDSARLRQVLTNLVANAVKFTEQGEIEIMVSAEGQDRVRFEVRDTGIGIPPELQERIFEAFTQADGSMTRRYSGSGLGLAIVRGLVTLMNGETGLKSTPGRGSSFWFTLPLPVSAEGAAVGDAPPSANKTCRQKNPAGRGRRHQRAHRRRAARQSRHRSHPRRQRRKSGSRLSQCAVRHDIHGLPDAGDGRL
jgi:hypothetical protein